MANNIGEANVEVHANTGGVRGEIRDGVDKAMDGVGGDAGKKFSNDFDKESSRGISGVASRLSEKIASAMESSGGESGKRFADKFRGAISGIGGGKINAPDLDTKALEAKIAIVKAKIDSLGEKKPSIKVEAETTLAHVQLEKLELKLRELTSNKRSIKIGIDQKGVTQSLVTVAALGRAIATLALPVAVIGATPAIASLGASAVQAAGALYLLPAAAGVAALGVGTLVTAFSHLGDALGPTGTPAQLKKQQEAMAALSPQARATALEIRGLAGSWTPLRQAVQDRFFQGISDDIKPLATTYLPLLQSAMVQVAGGFNRGATEMISFLRSSKGVTDLRIGLSNTANTATSLTAVIAPLGRALIDIFVVGSGYLNKYALGVVDLAKQFENYIAKARESGALNRIIDQAIVVVGQLWDVLSNVSQILYKVFQAGQEGAGTFLQTLVLVTGEVNKFLASPEGHDALVALFKAIHDTVAAVLPGIIALGGAIAKSIIILGPVLPQIGEAFSALAVAAAPFITQMASFAATVLPPIIHLITALAPALGPVIAAFGALYIATGFLGTIFKLVTDFTGAIRLVSIAQSAWTAIVWLFNAAMSANPITLVVIAIAALVAGIIVAYKNSETFRNIVDGAFRAVGAAVASVIDWFKQLPDRIREAVASAGQWFGGLYDSAVAVGVRVGEWITSLPTMIGNGLSSLGASISTTASTAWAGLVTAATDAGTATLNFLAELPGRIVYGLGYLVGAVARGAVTAFWGLVNGAIAAWDATYQFFVTLPERMAAFFVTLGTAIWNGAVAAFNRMIEAIQSGIERAVAFFEALPGRILAALVSLATTLHDAAVSAFNAFIAAVQAGIESAVHFFETLPGRIAAALVAFGTALYDGGVAALTGLYNGVINGYNAVNTWMTGLRDRFWAFVATAGDWLVQAGIDILNGLVNGLVSGVTAVWTWLGEMVDKFIQGFKDGFGIASPSTLFAQFGTWILEGFLNGLTSMVETIMTFASNFVTNFIAGFNSLLTLFSEIWNIIQQTVVTILTAVVAFVDSSLQNLSTLVTSVMTAVSTFWSSIWNAISAAGQAIFGAYWTYFQNALNNLWTFVQSVLNALRTFWETIWNAISAFGMAIWNALVSFYQSGFTNWRGLFEAFGNAIRAFWELIWNAIKAFGEQIWAAILAYFQQGFTNLRTLVETVMNAISAFWQSIWTAISNYAQAVYNAFYAFIQTGINNLRTLFDTVMRAISVAWNAIWTAISDFGRNTWTTLSTFLTNSINTFKTFWTTAWTQVKDGFNTAFGGIIAIAQRIWGDVKNVFRDGVNAIISGVNWPIQKINGLFSISLGTIPSFNGFADGGGLEGRVSGIGGRRADRVPSMLSPEEHVWSAKEVDRVGGHAGVRKIRELARSGALAGLADGGRVTRRDIPDLVPGAFVVEPAAAEVAGRFLNALNSGQPEAVQATGGRFARGPHLAAGGAIENALNVGRSMQGTPYVWGGASRSGADCSGFQSIITNALRMKANPFSRIGSTANFPWGGFQNGLGGAYTVGSTKNAGNGVGHMAGTLAGINVESGSGHGAMVGGRALGSTNGLFNTRAFLPEVGGAFVDGGGGGFFDPAAWFDSLTGGLRELAKATIRGIVPDRPELMEPSALGMFDGAWEGMRKTAIGLIQSVASFVTGGSGGSLPPANGPVQDQVRAVARNFGWDTGAAWDAINWIVNKESGWNPNAANPTSSARGLFQKMTSLHGPVEATAGGQAQWGLNYIKSTYGTPQAAMAHWQRVGSYDTGGWLQPGITQAINGTGKPEAIIADPMTTFEKSFRSVFKWLAPQMNAALATGNRVAFDSIVRQLGGEKDLGKAIARVFDKLPKALQAAIRDQYPTIAAALDSKQVDLVDAIGDLLVPAPVTIPPIVIPKPEVPPVVVPKVPTGELGLSFQDALRQFAPDLSLALKAGATDQTRQLAQDIIGNNERLAAISAAMGADVRPVLQNLIESLKPKVAEIPKSIPPITIPAPTWLEREVERLRQYALANLNKGSSAGDRLEQVGDDFSWRLVRAFEAAFPNIENAIDSSKTDVNRTLASEASSLLAWLQTRSAAEQVEILEALDGQDRSLADALKAAQATVKVTPTSSAPTLTIADGAFQVNIEGNADSVTVDQLRNTLVAWSDEILHQYEGRT